MIIPSSRVVGSVPLSCLLILLQRHGYYPGFSTPVVGASVQANINYPNNVSKKYKTRNNTGFYYGIRDDIFFPNDHQPQQKKKSDRSLFSKPLGEYFLNSLNLALNKKRPFNNGASQSASTAALEDILGETLLELREMREDIAALREEMQSMKDEITRSSNKIVGEAPSSSEREGSDKEQSSMDPSSAPSLGGDIAKRKAYALIGVEVEKWAQSLLQENEGEHCGWKEVKCNSMMAKKINKHGQTRCFIKWMKDSRGNQAIIDDDTDRVYPCLKCFSTINAPLEHVCRYLSNPNHVPEYNDLLMQHRDLEEISANSKVCWAMTPQVLFVKPRDFVTYCQHWWTKDDTQIVINQACEHDNAPTTTEEGDGEICRAYALRGANFLSRDPTDTNKTKFTMIIHANPGGGLPIWAMKTAINAVAPIEPFKLFYKIDKGVNTWANKLMNTDQAEEDRGGIIRLRAAGLSQLGYACFWPNND